MSEVIKKGYNKDFKYEELTEYNIGNILGVTEEELRTLFTAHEDMLYINPVLNDNALDIIREWDAHGYEVYILTARPKELERQTITWLESIGLPYSKLYMLGSYQKQEIVGLESIDIFIEDRRETIQTVEEASIETINILIDTPYNQGELSNHSKRVTTWEDIRKFVDNLGVTVNVKSLESELSR